MLFRMLGRRQVAPRGFGLFLCFRVAMHESVGVACVTATHGGVAALDPGLYVVVAQDIEPLNCLSEKALSSQTCDRL